MELSIKGHEVHVGDRLRELILKKTARLDRYLPAWAVIDAKLDLYERHSRTDGPLKLAEMTVATRGAILRAEAKAPEFAAALDEVVDRMTRRIVRYRQRYRDQQRRPADEPTLPELPAEAADLDDESSISLTANAQPVRIKRFAAKPMDVSEAIEQMELLGHDFFLFVNNDDQRASVVYRRREGGYGLIQPEFP
jgi:putative sigma-54 modulation protein